jgi:hypothetical protein
MIWAVITILVLYVAWQIHAQWRHDAYLAQEWREMETRARASIRRMQAFDANPAQQETLDLLIRIDVDHADLCETNARKFEQRIPTLARARYLSRTNEPEAR